jgi:hypothetical protein
MSDRRSTGDALTVEGFGASTVIAVSEDDEHADAALTLLKELDPGISWSSRRG